MTVTKTVLWDEVARAAEHMCDDGIEGSVDWLKKSWDHLTKANLTSYSTERERSQVLVRFLALGGFWKDYCRVAWGAGYEWDEIIEYEKWAPALGLSAFRVGMLAGALSFWEKEMDEEDDTHITLRCLHHLANRARQEIFAALRDGHGGIDNLFSSLCRINPSRQQGPDVPVAYMEPEHRLLLFLWIDSGCKPYGY